MLNRTNSQRSPKHVGHVTCIDGLQRVPSKYRSDVSRGLEQLAEAIAELGPDRALRSFGDEAQTPMFGVSKGTAVVTAIPGNGAASCSPVLFGVARGARNGSTGFSTVCRMVRARLIDCPATEVVVLVSDSWDPRLLAESIEDFRARRRHGMEVLIFVAHSGGLSEINPGL